ncbi:GNAT family N-acetyltransferase [Edaphocola aurantiacus]|uniref:GNAT family N-acetyltransferase n=1 Tax=Edaphocola aurantiacus TaxID=2601682 RepID=UPI001C96354E|nr:GNAT family N-acetyltransferase [Edaphocola aurantiacus]
MDKEYSIHTGYEAMDIAAIHHYLSQESYWAKGIPFETVQRSLQHSFCIGVFTGGRQIGFARLVTDYSTFGYLADVYILPAHRGKGLSKEMMQYIMDLDWMAGLRRIMLATLDAHGLYQQFGFKVTETPERIMERRKEQAYTK